MKRTGWVLATAVPVAIGGFVLSRTQHPTETAQAAPQAVPAPPPPTTAMPPEDHDHDDDRSYVFRMPSGEPTALSCEEARTVVEQVRAGLAYAPDSVPSATLATSAADWLDPHGLLSLAKDAPTTRAITKVSSELVADLEGRRQRDCAAALGPAGALEQWAGELRAEFDRGRKTHDASLATLALEPLPPTGVAREMAFEIGRRAGAFETKYGDQGKLYAEEARRRFFPPLDKAGWQKVVLASAVRAYVPLVDPHGEWAPFDEESRIYEVDLASRPPSRLWGRAVPTAVGVRVTDGAAAPLADGDVVLSVGSMSTAGLPLEQVDQLGFAAADAKMPLTAIVLRGGAITTVELGARTEDGGAAPASKSAAELPSERVAFGDGDALVVAIKDVRDDLGDELAQMIVDERDKKGRSLEGVVLDLRGNGGGSTDGALGALSLFLPGLPLFAMKRRDGTIEIDRAPVPRDRERWTGPVATLVDGTTASAAEMIAGALASYKRGPTVGTTTFGKGCAQEYVDDDAHAGVLRLTTLVYALPDGSPVQRVGLAPQIRFPFTPQPGDGAADREAKLAHSAPPWRGPDLRDPQAARPHDEAAWPAHGGNVGPCKDAEVCKALRLLSGAPKRAPSLRSAKH